MLSIALMVVDARFDALQPVRSQLGLFVSPLYYVAELPVRGWNTVTELTSSRAQLIADNERLRAEALLTQRKLQKLATLTEQNVRLRELLNSSSLVDERVLVAELIGVDPNPFTQRILIDKGENDGVFLGQPVLDATGLMGQVVEVLPYSARVLMITDASHSLPVQVNRNGLRAIASGTGRNEWLELRYVGDTADIREGDIVVSSGLGQRFPAGYPVGRVQTVVRHPSQSFAEVRVTPSAQLNRSRYLLLVFSPESGYGDVLPALDLTPDKSPPSEPPATDAESDAEPGEVGAAATAQPQAAADTALQSEAVPAAAGRPATGEEGNADAQ